MSTSICLTECLDALEVPVWDAGCETEVGRNFGYDNPFIFRCDVAFTNILDAAEWEAKIEDGSIIKLPCSNFDPGDGDETEIGRTCKKVYYDTPTYTYTYESFEVLKNCEDEDFYCNLHELVTSGKYPTFGFIKCEGCRIILPKSQIKAIKAGLAGGGAVPMSNVGFPLSMSTPKFGQVNGPGKFGKWGFTGEIKNSGVMISADVPGVCATLATSNYTG